MRHTLDQTVADDPCKGRASAGEALSNWLHGCVSANGSTTCATGRRGCNEKEHAKAGTSQGRGAGSNTAKEQETKPHDLTLAQLRTQR